MKTKIFIPLTRLITTRFVGATGLKAQPTLKDAKKLAAYKMFQESIRNNRLVDELHIYNATVNTDVLLEQAKFTQAKFVVVGTITIDPKDFECTVRLDDRGRALVLERIMNAQPKSTSTRA